MDQRIILAWLTSALIYLPSGLMTPLDMATQTNVPITTLPATNSQEAGRDLCNFTDHNSLLDHVEGSGANYNLSLLVGTCSGVCSLVYGSGNPDISGIGV
jgi:hypothetical protein